MAGRSSRRDQGWIGAVAIGGLLLFATTFLRPSAVINRSRAREAAAAADGARTSGGDSDRRTRTVSRVEASEARALLSKVAATYQRAQRYQDRTVMKVYRRDDPTRLLDKAEIFVEFERPNRLRVDVHRDHDQLLLLSNGTQMFARIIDPGTNNFDNQLVVKPAPNELTIQTLYELCDYTRFDQPDERYSALMSLPAPLLVSQLSLLLEPDAMSQLLSQAEQVEQLDDDVFRGLPSKRVRVTTSGGEFVFWIDPYASQLQRIEFPSPDSAPNRDLSGTENSVASRSEASGVASVAEFRDRRFDQPARSASFELPISAASQPVRNFILPPEDRSADLLGRVVTGYWFTDLYGDRRDDRDSKGQISVMVWFGNHASSRAVLQETQAAASRYQGDDRIRFQAICVEPSTSMSHRQVDDLLRTWSIRFSVVRDLEAFGRDVFRIQQAPTLVVLDGQNRVQLVEIGGSTTLDEQLSAVLDRLLAGENLAQRYLDHLHDQRQTYERLLSKASVPAPQLNRPLRRAGDVSPLIVP